VRAARLTALPLLAVLVMLAVNLKVRLSTTTPRYDPQDETAYFRTESALQYRYARFAAAGRPLPDPDRAAQWPEGLRPGKELTSVMERLTGLSYRLFAPAHTEFRWFVLLWAAVVSSLSMVALYFCALELTGSAAAALLAAAAYGLSWAAQSNEIASFRLETLGLPLMFGSLACAGAFLGGGRRVWAAASAAFLLAAFASWHLSRFYLATYLAALGVAYWRGRDQRLLEAAAWAAGAGVLATILVPSARESLFIASPGAYGHVYGLVFTKLAHGLRHPADPAALSPVQRLEWTGPSDSPDPGFALFAFLPLALVLLPRVWGRLRDSPPASSAFSRVCDALFWIYLLGTVLASRLTPWLAFFLVLFSLTIPARLKKPLALALAAAAVLETLKCLAPASPLNPFMRLSVPFASEELRPTISLPSERQLLYWLSRYGGPDRPALAPMGLSAEIVTYADTPVLLQPKWEAPLIREKTAEYAKTLFEDEAAFAAYCAKYQAKLVVYGADTLLDETPEGLRYASGDMTVREDSAAYLFHFFPEKLKGFRLVFQNDAFRVFAVEPNKGEPYPKLPVYDRAQYGKALDARGALRRMQLAQLKVTLARVLTQLGRPEEALSSYDEAFAAWPPDEALRKEYDALKSRLSPPTK
jgi:hypothetical protein